MSTPPFYDAKYYRASPTWNTWVKCTCAFVHALKIEAGFYGQALRHYHLNHPIRFVCVTGPVTAIDDISSRYTVLTVDDGSGRTIEIKITRITRDANADDEGDNAFNGFKSCDNPTGGAISPKGKKSAVKALKPAPAALPTIGHRHLPTTQTTIANLNVHSRPPGTFRVLLDGEEVVVGSVIKAKGTLAEFRGVPQLDLKRLFVVRSTSDEVAAWRDITAHARMLASPWVLSRNEIRRIDEKLDSEAKHEEHVKKTKREKEERREERRKRRKERLRAFEEKENSKLKILSRKYDMGAIDTRK